MLMAYLGTLSFQITILYGNCGHGLIYKYDIRVGFPPGITSPREDCRLRATILARGSYS